MNRLIRSCGLQPAVLSPRLSRWVRICWTSRLVTVLPPTLSLLLVPDPSAWLLEELAELEAAEDELELDSLLLDLLEESEEDELELSELELESSCLLLASLSRSLTCCRASRRTLRIAIFAFSLTMAPKPAEGEEAFGGSDAAVTAILEDEHGALPWFSPIFEPGSGEIESGLFALQAAIGAGFIGYYLGVARTREKLRREREREQQQASAAAEGKPLSAD